MLPSTPRCYGIVAGSGAIVKEVIHACVQENLSFFILAFIGQTYPSLVNSYPHTWVSLGQIGQALEALKKAKVTHLVMAGRFQRPSFAGLKVDRVGALWMADMGLKAWGDDGLLKIIFKKLEAEGFEIIAPETLMGKDALMPEDDMGPVPMPPSYETDALIGVQVLKALSPFDCGQAVIIQGGRLLGVEGPEGTNSLMERCAAFIDASPGQRGAILVKGCKVGQELRADRPVVGPDTLKHLQRHGYKGLVLQTQGVLIADQTEFRKKLNQSSLFCIGKPFV